MENNENNVQNQKKKQSKGLSAGLVIIMLIAVLIIGIGGGYLLSKNSNLFNKNETKPNNTIEQTKTSKKIDESKPWVYDAEYRKNKTVKKIDTTNNSDKDLVVPYININSTAGKKANTEIEKLYNEIYEKYATDINESAKNFSRLNYKFYENNNLLSIVIENSNGAIPGGAGRCPLYVYNFNLDTLEIATNEELAKQTGYNSIAEVTEIANKWIAKVKTDEEIEESGGTITGLVKDTYFIDGNNKLNFVYTAAAAGTYDYYMIVDKAKEYITTNKNNTNTQQNQTTSNNTTSATNDIQKYLGKWYDENNSSELDILSIANGYCSFSWGIYRSAVLDNAVIPMKNNSGSFYFQGYDDKNFNSQQDEGEHYYRKATISLNNDSITIKVENIDHTNYDITQEKDFPGQVYLTEATYTFKIK